VIFRGLSMVKRILTGDVGAEHAPHQELSSNELIIPSDAIYSSFTCARFPRPEHR
jgi:hypothetical protein